MCSPSHRTESTRQDVRERERERVSTVCSISNVPLPPFWESSSQGKGVGCRGAQRGLCEGRRERGTDGPPLSLPPSLPSGRLVPNRGSSHRSPKQLAADVLSSSLTHTQTHAHSLELSLLGIGEGGPSGADSRAVVLCHLLFFLRAVIPSLRTRNKSEPRETSKGGRQEGANETDELEEGKLIKMKAASMGPQEV